MFEILDHLAWSSQTRNEHRHRADVTLKRLFFKFLIELWSSYRDYYSLVSPFHSDELSHAC